MKRLSSLLKNKLLWLLVAAMIIVIKMASGYFSEAVAIHTASVVRNYSEGLIASAVEEEVLTDLEGANFFNESYDSNGKVSYAYVDSLKLNQVRNDVIQYTDEAISLINEHSDFEYIEIPFGYIFGIKYFLTDGIRIPIRLEVIGNQDVEIVVDTTTKGINTTIVEIYLDVSVDVQVVIPFQSELISTETKIPLTIEIMNNEIPYYLGDIME